MKKLKAFIRRFFPNSLVNRYHLAVAILANVIYGFPARKMRIIGVTGTNGKTTTCHLITDILRASGRRVGMTTTIDFRIDNQLVENNLKMTTVSPFLLQKLLKKMVEAGCQDVVLEVTSIALDQHRLWGIKFAVAVFTNLTHDHLDYHKSMTNYRLAKEKLFDNRPFLSVVNLDDPSAEHFLKHTANHTITYAIEGRADLMAKKVYPRPGGTDFVLLLNDSQRQATVNLPLPGVFNVANALAAAATCLGLGVNLEAVVDSLNDAAPVAGRMELVDVGQSFTVIIDYAHTPDALQKVYETIKPTVHGKLISVLGATGCRDRTKRPILGALAGRFADYVFITNEDPYTEDPLQIMNEVAVGVPKGRPRRGRMKTSTESEIPFKYRETGEGLWWWQVPDRREAIARALKLARPQDVVLVTGKGAEKVMAVGHKLIPWSDRAVLEEELKKYVIN